MAYLSTRSAHNYQLGNTSTIQQAARIARHAVRSWFAGIPTQTLMEFRDSRCSQHFAGVSNALELSEAFNSEFAKEVGRVIVEGVSHAK